MENRIIELETRVAFQDKTIEDLNEVVADQQQQIDNLERQIRHIYLKLQAMLPTEIRSMEEGTANRPF